MSRCSCIIPELNSDNFGLSFNRCLLCHKFFLDNLRTKTIKYRSISEEPDDQPLEEVYNFIRHNTIHSDKGLTYQLYYRQHLLDIEIVGYKMRDTSDFLHCTKCSNYIMEDYYLAYPELYCFFCIIDDLMALYKTLWTIWYTEDIDSYLQWLPHEVLIDIIALTQK